MADIARDDDALVFAGEVADESTLVVSGHTTAEPWRILIVDDDPDVHTTTTFALRGTEILGRTLDFLHADSAQRALELMQRDRDIAVILLDVVMEQDDSGLRLVRIIREELGMTEARIILRTGQPGRAPEMEAIRDFDVNDYRTKSELTRNKLYATLTAAIRAYTQIRTINASRRGLKMIVRASGELLALSGVREFSAGVLTQLAAFFGVRPEGLVCVQNPPQAGMEPAKPMVTAAAGRYASMLGHPLEQISDPRAKESLLRSLKEGRYLSTPDGTCLYFAAPGGCRMVAFLKVPLPADDMFRQLLEVLGTNISVGLQNTQLYSQMHANAYYDSLTGLPNRSQLINILDERLSGSARGRYSLVIIDIDGFSETNDALGHQFGDDLLRAVSQRMRRSLESDTSLARLSSDTFAVVGLIEQLLPARLQGIFKEPFVFENQELMVSVTMGIVHLTDVDGNGAEAVKSGYVALRRAKRGQRGEFAFFTRDMALEIRERSKLMHALRGAVERQRFFLAYQPQISLATGLVTGVEALLRWKAEDGKLVEPDRFIPIAEHSGMIVSMGEWALRTACLQQVALAAQGFGNMCVAVNVSMGQFRHPRFLPALQSALAESGADPCRIELEITESMAMDEVDLLSKCLDSIKNLGLKVSIDDFGTGFSSFSYLQRLKVDRLKIDKDFIADILTDERARRIPEVMIELAHKLGLTVLAEGVELHAQADMLRNLGCEDAQGYLYGRPMEPPQMLEWLRTHAEEHDGAR